MRKLRYVALAAVLAAGGDAAFAAGPEADEPGTYWQESWKCGKEIHPSRALLQMLQKNQALGGYSVRGKALPVLVGSRLGPLGLVLFVQQEGRWHTYPIAGGHMVMGTYSTPAYDRLMLFTMWGVEGPGGEYVVLRGKQQLTHFDCIHIPFPPGLNQPLWGNEFLGLYDFNVGKSGKGALVGSVRLEREGGEGQDRWFRYGTSDWGKTWGKAKPLKAAPHAKLPGVFQPAREIPPPKHLLDSLLKSAS